MSERRGLFHAVSGFVHDYFLWLLLASYALAALSPAWGLWVVHVSFGEIPFTGGKPRPELTLPMVLVGVLLVNAGLGVETSRLTTLARSLPLLSAGLAVRLLVPFGFVWVVGQVMASWPDPDESERLVVGLAVLVAMPAAASSTAWSQDANGNMTLSLGLVVISTLLSFLTTPAVLHEFELLANEDTAPDLHRQAGHRTGAFLTACVVLPSVLGIGGRVALGKRKVEAVMPQLKLTNRVILLLINYANGSVFLPKVMADPSWDFLAVTLGWSVGLSLLTFASGLVLARLFRTGPAERASLVFGLGMTQVMTALVLASVAVPAHTRVMLPIIIYNLVQNLAAGVAAYLLDPGPDEDLRPASPGGEYKKCQEPN
jgi:BASS family bile acid:Na+ symporter